ncbi:MAG TPA: hypothetical protein VIG99_23270 [Myxococcaceae bacterium]|jgi:hypothetical protein
MDGFVRAATVMALTALLSGAGGLFARDDCSSDCLEDSKQDPCRDASVPCGGCAACPCAHRAPVLPPAQVAAPIPGTVARPLELAATAPVAPARARPFQPPRC